MLAQSSSAVARRAQCLLHLRRLNTCTGQGNIVSFSSQNPHKSSLFSLENPWDFTGNGVLHRALVPLHLQMGFRYFSVNSLESYRSQDDEFSKLDAKEINKGEGFKEGSEVDIDDEFSELDAKELNKGEGFKEGSEVDIDDEFSELDAKEINKGEGFKEGSEVDISSQTEPESVQSKPIDLLFKEAVLSKPVDLVFKEAIGLENMPENKRLNSEIGGMGNLQPESQLEKSRSMLGFQREIINTLRGTVNGLESTIKEIKRKIAALENSEKQMTKNYLELKKSLSGKTHNNTEESSAETEVPENLEKGAKSEKKKRTTTKKVRLKEKPSVDSGVGSLEHPWAEWVQFLEHLNDSGYLSKALRFQGGPIDLRDCSMKLLGHHIRFAAQIFAKDHAEISKLLSGSDMRKVALFGCPSLEKKDVFAAKRLRSFFNIEQGTACRPCNLKDTCSAPFAKVSKVKSLTAEDVVRLLSTFGLNAEKNELSTPDDVKQSVVNLLKELVDFSTSSSNGDQGLSLQE